MTAQTDDKGLATASFAMPDLAGGMLVVGATSGGAQTEVILSN